MDNQGQKYWIMVTNTWLHVSITIVSSSALTERTYRDSSFDTYINNNNE